MPAEPVIPMRAAGVPVETDRPAPLAVEALTANSKGPVTAQSSPLLVDIRGLSRLLCRSVGSLCRDDAAGRLPAALRIGSSKRWRLSEITAWTEAGCPPRAVWEAMRRGKDGLGRDRARRV
jgi:hypothetical protein